MLPIQLGAYYSFLHLKIICKLSSGFVLLIRIPRGMNLKKPKRTFWKGMQEQPLPWKMVRLVEDQEHEVELGKSDYTLFSRKCNNYLQRSMK